MSSSGLVLLASMALLTGGWRMMAWGLKRQLSLFAFFVEVTGAIIGCIGATGFVLVGLKVYLAL